MRLPKPDVSEYQRSFEHWLDELAMHIVEHRPDQALMMLHDAWPSDMPSVRVARMLSEVRSAGNV